MDEHNHSFEDVQDPEPAVQPPVAPEPAGARDGAPFQDGPARDVDRSIEGSNRRTRVDDYDSDEEEDDEDEDTDEDEDEDGMGRNDLQHDSSSAYDFFTDPLGPGLTAEEQLYEHFRRIASELGKQQKNICHAYAEQANSDL